MKEHKLINPYDPAVHCIQSRLGTSLEKIEEYTAMMQADIQFDPCAGFVDSNGDIWIYDGKHRRESAIAAGSMLLCELEPGTQQDAEWHAAHANTRHGLPRTRNDIINAVNMALRHPYGQQKSDRELALWCGCDHKTVGKYRSKLEASGEIPQVQTRTITRGEQEYQMEIPAKPDPVETEIIKEKGLYFDMLFDIDESGECERLTRTVLPSESDFVPLTAQAAETKGWCHSCPYASSGHYLNENGFKWCTLSIIQDLDLRKILKTDKIQRYNLFHKPEAPASDADDQGDLEPEEEFEEDKTDEEETEEHAIQARLERCRECLNKYYLVKVDGVLGVTKIYEVNEYLAKVRGVTYPYDPLVPFKGMAAGTLNFELEELINELSDQCWKQAKWDVAHKGSNSIEPPSQPTPEPEECKAENSIDIKEIRRLRRILQDPDIRDSRRFEAIDAIDTIEFFALLHLLDWPDDLESLYVNFPSGRISTLRELRTPTEFNSPMPPSTLLEFWEPETKINDNDVYRPDYESVAGTPEYYFRQCTLDVWQIFLRYWRFKQLYGNVKSRLKTLE